MDIHISAVKYENMDEKDTTNFFLLFNFNL